MMRLEPSAPLNLLTYIVLYLFFDPCFLLMLLTLDQINEVSQYFWLLVNFVYIFIYIFFSIHFLDRDKRSKPDRSVVIVDIF